MFCLKNHASILLAAGFLLIVQIQVQAVIFYDLENFTGDSWAPSEGWLDTMTSADGTNWPKCNNMPLYFNDRASSVNLEDRCVILYLNFDCTGFSLLLEGDQSGNLKDRNLDNVVSSFRGCPDWNA